MVSWTSVLFPEPETPVTQVNVPNGIFTVMFLRLCSVAPTSTSARPVPWRRRRGTGIVS